MTCACGPFQTSCRTAVSNSINRIEFTFNTAVARRLKPSRATAVQHDRGPVTRQSFNIRLNKIRRLSEIKSCCSHAQLNTTFEIGLRDLSPLQSL